MISLRGALFFIVTMYLSAGIIFNVLIHISNYLSTIQIVPFNILTYGLSFSHTILNETYGTGLIIVGGILWLLSLWPLLMVASSFHPDN